MKALNRGERVFVLGVQWRFQRLLAPSGAFEVTEWIEPRIDPAIVTKVQDSDFKVSFGNIPSRIGLSRCDENRTWCRSDQLDALRVVVALS